MKNFHRQWLGLSKIDEIAAGGRDPELYPEYRDELLPLFQAETEAFLDHAIFEEDASVSTLFTASYSMMNRELAELYGIEEARRARRSSGWSSIRRSAPAS